MVHDVNNRQTQTIARERRPWAVALLSVLTLGVYSVVWYYKVNREMRDYGSASGDSDLAESNPTQSVLAVTIGGLIVIPLLVSFVRVVGRIQRVERIATGTSRGGAGLIALLVGSEVVGLLAGLAGTSVFYLLAAGAYLTAIALIQSRLNAVWQQDEAVANHVAVEALDTTETPTFG
jgi:sugar phosphate permease